MTKEEKAADYATGTKGFELVVDPTEKRAYLAGYTDCEREKDAVIEKLREALEYISNSDCCDSGEYSCCDSFERRAREALAAVEGKKD